MRIALAQTNILWEDKQANLVRAEEFVIAAGAEIILFPEMSLTGFSMHTDVTAENCESPDVVQACVQTGNTQTMTELPQTGWTIDQVSALARRHHKTIGIGWVKKTEPLCENHYSIVTPDGSIAMDYVKIHPFSYGEEHAHFRGGEKPCTGKLGEFQAGLAICYDLRFPEQFRTMVPEAEIFIVPANWPEARTSHWKTLLAARAIENQCYVAGVNCCGDMDGQYYSGDSGVYAPDGSLLVPMREIRLADDSCKEEKLLVYDIQNDVTKIRDAFPVLQDRKEMKCS
jgi:omega-amidase